MNTQLIKAKYVGDGLLRLLGDIRLSEGDEVSVRFEPLDSRSRAVDSSLWLQSELAGELPPYEWGKAGLPKVKPVKYSRSRGFVIDDEK